MFVWVGDRTSTRELLGNNWDIILEVPNLYGPFFLL